MQIVNRPPMQIVNRPPMHIVNRPPMQIVNRPPMQIVNRPPMRIVNRPLMQIVTNQAFGNFCIPNSYNLIAPTFTTPMSYQQYPSVVLANQIQLQNLVKFVYYAQPPGLQLQQMQYYHLHPVQMQMYPVKLQPL